VPSLPAKIHFRLDSAFCWHDADFDGLIPPELHVFKIAPAGVNKCRSSLIQILCQTAWLIGAEFKVLIIIN
jgi:hypothetical protein